MLTAIAATLGVIVGIWISGVIGLAILVVRFERENR